jgi:hypothetical protein
MAADIFAMESMTLVAASRVDRDKHADVRLEAALCKLWATEATWRIVNDAVQIRGGRGYETAESLKARGEPPIALERMLRDCRINTIFEGSSEIMRLFIARELLDPHLKVGAAALNSQLPLGRRLRAAAKAGLFYSMWYPKQWLPGIFHLPNSEFQIGGRHLRYVARTSRRLARAIFHAMLRHGPKLDREQLLLGRFVDIGAELFAMTAAALRGGCLLNSKDATTDERNLPGLIDYFCQAARLRIEQHFHDLHHNTDAAGYRLAQQLLADKFEKLETGIVQGNAIESEQQRIIGNSHKKDGIHPAKRMHTPDGK